MFGFTWLEMYDKYYLKPILITLFESGIGHQKIADVLNLLDIKNYQTGHNGEPWSVGTLANLYSRLWNPSHDMGSQNPSMFKEIREIFTEPLIIEYIKKGFTQTEISKEMPRRALQKLMPIINKKKINSDIVKMELKIGIGYINWIYKSFCSKKISEHTF
ncbi:MAG: hypothetical protein ACFFCM_20875 [Promethearchaeota archaeon]